MADPAAARLEPPPPGDPSAAAGSAGLSACHLVAFPRITDPRGNLSFVEGGHQIPFEIARVYWLYDVPGGAERGGHAHRDLEQVIVAMSGSFDVVLDDGTISQRFHLNRSYAGLYVPRMIWREIDNFSSGSVCMVLASAHFSEADYIRDQGEYRRIVTCGSPSST